MRFLVAVGIVVGSLGMCAAIPADAQPFGIVQGSAPSTYKGVLTDTPSVYWITPPKSHPAFESYMVLSTPNAGICRVVAVGKLSQMTLMAHSCSRNLSHYANR